IVAYLVLGWAVLPLYGPLVDSVSTASLMLLLAGGTIYSAGVAVHLSRLRYQNALWHAMVLAAAACHYAAVVDTVILRG
ncbi:MAG: hemolysin III family protein, partial [Alphaproteobacteria bacterium]|nr:hemolysin III family protein [Alphaproteobacteria bacterium]